MQISLGIFERLLNSLSTIDTNVEVHVRKVNEGPLQKRLTEMGLYPGQKAKILFKAPLRDPIAVKVGNGTVLLRKEEAAEVLVEKVGDEYK